MYARCDSNLFGNDNFTKGKKYELIKWRRTYVIETDYPDCYLICNIHHKTTRTNCFGFGMCGFVYYDEE